MSGIDLQASYVCRHHGLQQGTRIYRSKVCILRQGTRPMLKDYSSNKEVNHLFWNIEQAIHTCIDLGLGSSVAGRKQYSRERIRLLNQLDGTSRLHNSHLLQAHDRCPLQEARFVNSAVSWTPCKLLTAQAEATCSRSWKSLVE